MTDHLPLLVGSGLAAYVAYNALSPYPSVSFTAAPIATTPKECDELCKRVAANAEKWNQTSAADKLDYLREMIDIYRSISTEAGKRSAALRGWTNTEIDGFATVFSTYVGSSFLHGLIETYSSLAAGNGVPGPTGRRTSGTQEIVTVAPRGLWQKATNPAIVELISKPGTTMKQSQQAPVSHEGLAAVMSPGNFESPIDVLHKLFIDGQVCVAKSHPGNAVSMNLIMSSLFHRLAKDGFVGLASGDVEIGSALLNNSLVHSWMMTGGCQTFDAITWGKKGKENGQKQLDKPCHAELGAASPYLVVPGVWSDAEMEAQAKLLCGYKALNVGAICASPQTVILDRNWPQALQFVDAVAKELKFLPNVAPYYAGTNSRLLNLEKNAPAVQTFDNQFHLIRDLDASGGGGEYLLKNEIFGPGLGFKFLEAGNSPERFLELSVKFSNEKCFGSLSMSLAAHPESIKSIGKEKFDAHICALNWGVLGINLWAGFMPGNSYGVWGAAPDAHSDLDIQSGKGLQGNCLFFDHIQKSTITGKWCDPMIVAFVYPSAKTNKLAPNMAMFSINQTVGSLCRTLGSLLF